MYIVAKFKHSATTNTMKVAPIYTEPSVKDRLKQFQVTSFYSHDIKLSAIFQFHLITCKH